MSQEQQQENKQKIRIGLIFGGRLGEHEVSLASANAVMANLDKDKYEVIPIGITKTGAWLLGTDPTRLLAAPDAQPNSAQSDQQATTAVPLTGDPNVRRLIPLQNGTQLHDNRALDVIFPSCMAPMAKMVPFRACWRWQMYPTLAAAFWARHWAWIKKK